MKKLLGQKGLTLVEMTVTIALIAVLGGIVYSVIRFADRQTKVQTEDIQNLIMMYGGSKVLRTDISRATPSFNFMHFPDKDNKPFFVLAQNDYCRNESVCERTIKLEIPPGQKKSEPFFLLTINSIGNEMIRFNIEPTETFVSSAFAGLNPNFSDPDLSIAKSNLEYSPWDKGRLILLSTSNQFFDCNSQTSSMTFTGPSCEINCGADGSCNYATARFLKFLGVVNVTTQDMAGISVMARPNLFNTNYQVCRPDANLNCIVSTPFTATSTKDLIEKMPYLPGSDNLANISPVQLVRYHLEKPAPNSPDHEIFLMRSVAIIAGTNQLSFDTGHIIMTGLQSIVFTRKNISNPTIEYKLNKVRTQSSIK